MKFLPFLLFVLFCFLLVGLIRGLFYLLVRFGRTEADKSRMARCPQCQTRRKPHKTGDVRNLVEYELQCPECGYISWDIPPKIHLSTRPGGKSPPDL